MALCLHGSVTILATPAVACPDPEHLSEKGMGTQHLVNGAQHNTGLDP